MVAPTAFIRPISRVRSVTDTSMMLMMPTAPSPSVTIPTPPRKTSIAVKIAPTIFSSWTVLNSSNASPSEGSNPCRSAITRCTAATAAAISPLVAGWYWIEVNASAGMLSPFQRIQLLHRGDRNVNLLIVEIVVATSDFPHPPTTVNAVPSMVMVSPSICRPLKTAGLRL